MASIQQGASAEDPQSTRCGGRFPGRLIGPADWTQGVRPGETAEASLPYCDKRLVRNEARGNRERTAPCDKPKGKLSFN